MPLEAILAISDLGGAGRGAILQVQWRRGTAKDHYLGKYRSKSGFFSTPSAPRARRWLLRLDLHPAQVVRSLHEEDDLVIALGEWD